MLVEFNQKVKYFKADMVKAKSEGNKTRYYSDKKQMEIYWAKVQWVKKQLVNPVPPPPKPSNYTKAELEKMYKEFTQKVKFFKDDMVKAKSEGNKTRYYSDLKQIKIYIGKIAWVKKQLIPPTPPSPPKPSKFTHD